MYWRLERTDAALLFKGASALLAPQPIEVAGHFFFIDRLIAETVRGSRVSAAKADQLNEPRRSLVAAKMNVQPQSIPSRNSLWFRLSSLAAVARRYRYRLYPR